MRGDANEIHPDTAAHNGRTGRGYIENHANGAWPIRRPGLLGAGQVVVDFILAKVRDNPSNISQECWFFPKIERFDTRCIQPFRDEAGGE